MLESKAYWTLSGFMSTENAGFYSTCRSLQGKRRLGMHIGEAEEAYVGCDLVPDGRGSPHEAPEP